MPQLPWKKWYPQDWKSDPKLDQCSAATRGIWADAISTMMLLDSDHLTGTDEQLSRFCRCSIAEINAAHKELLDSKTADVSIQNGYKHWQSRRLHRELEISGLRREAVGKRWKKGDTKAHTKALQGADTNNHTRSASASVLCVLKEGVRGRFQEWMVFRKGLGKKPKDWAAMFKKQAEWLSQFSEPDQLAILDQSIRNGWQGLFEPNRQNSNGHRPMSVFEVEKRVTAISQEINAIFRRNGSKRIEGDGIDALKKRRDELQRSLVS